MWFVSLFLFILLLVYILIMLFYKHHWDNVEPYVLSSKYTPKTTVSVIIAARNEEKNIAECLESIAVQDYPNDMYELIVIDDHSSDQTGNIIKNYAQRYPFIKYLHLSDFVVENEVIAHKKAAISYGISQAKNTLIVSTDADCLAQSSWLKYIVDFYQTQNPKFIAAPIAYHREKNIFEKFQSVDVCSTMGITAASIRSKLSYISNGANLAYPKSVFEEMKGFEGINKIASGDDIMLMQKISEKYKDDIKFLLANEATIKTCATRNLKNFYQQRLRWATKNSKLQDRSIPWILAAMLGFNILLFICTISLFFHLGLWKILLFVWVSKCVVDSIFLYSTTHFFHKSHFLKHFFIFEIMHVLYIIVIGIAANVIKNYTWKQRTLK